MILFSNGAWAQRSMTDWSGEEVLVSRDPPSVNHLDIAPQHASVLMGLSNTFATMPGILSPLITGWVVTDKSADQWQVVFYIASTIYLLGALFYGIFASGERQPWAMDDVDQNGHQEHKNDNHAYVNKAMSDESV